MVKCFLLQWNYCHTLPSYFYFQVTIDVNSPEAGVIEKVVEQFFEWLFFLDLLHKILYAHYINVCGRRGFFHRLLPTPAICSF